MSLYCLQCRLFGGVLNFPMTAKVQSHSQLSTYLPNSLSFLPLFSTHFLFEVCFTSRKNTHAHTHTKLFKAFNQEIDITLPNLRNVEVFVNLFFCHYCVCECRKYTCISFYFYLNVFEDIFCNTRMTLNSTRTLSFKTNSLFP